MSSKTLEALKKKHPDKILQIDYDEGYWITLADGWIETTTDTHTIHEETVKDTLREFRNIRREKLNTVKK